MTSVKATAGFLPHLRLSSPAAPPLHSLSNSPSALFDSNGTTSLCLQLSPLHSRSLRRRLSLLAVSHAASLSHLNTEVLESDGDDDLPTPTVIIDQESDPHATVVELSFGNRLGALLDTMQALKELGLNVERSRITVEGPITRKRFSITRVDDGRKIEDPELLEAIRLTIINNMIEYHPESSSLLAMGSAFGIQAPRKDLSVLLTYC